MAATSEQEVPTAPLPTIPLHEDQITLVAKLHDTTARVHDAQLAAARFSGRHMAVLRQIGEQPLALSLRAFDAPPWCRMRLPRITSTPI
jgi:hypothetical protein